MSEKFGGRHRRELIERVRNPSDLVRPVRACPVGPRSGGPISVRVDFSVRLGEVSVCGYFECGGSWRGGADTWVVRDARHALQDCCPALCRCPRGLRGLGVVGVAHSRVLCVGGNRGVMRDSNVSSGHGSAPMCNTDDNHAPHRDRSTSGTRSVQVSPANPTSRHARQARGRRSHAAPQTIGEQQVRSSATDFDAKADRSRRGLRPISSRVTTDLGVVAVVAGYRWSLAGRVMAQ